MLILLAWLPIESEALELTFTAAAPEYEADARAYAAIWEQDGDRIVRALEETAGVELTETQIDVIVLEAMSSSGRGAQPMELRASYPEAVKRGTMVHELAHRYLIKLRPIRGLTIHQQLNLLLIPVWETLWGREFVDGQLQVESGWSRDYQHAWAWALALSDAGRQRELGKLRGD